MRNDQLCALNSKELLPDDIDAYQQILKILHFHSKVDFSNYKETTIRRRLEGRMQVHKIRDLGEYLDFLKHVPTELQALYDDILINVTSFFRDPEVFQVLKDKIIPQILRERELGKPIRIWVPGCSTGQEVYSLLICFSEILGEALPTIPIQVFATDISENVIKHARYGIYPPTISKELSPERLNRFFIKLQDDRYQIRQYIRDMCVFVKRNINSDIPFSNIDLISCRNLLIYFDKDLQKQVVPILHYSLKKSGHLILGASESIRRFSDLFTVKDKICKIYEKKPSSSRKLYLNFLSKNFH